MHALFITAKIDPARDEQEGIRYLEEDVFPLLRQVPGLVGGYWMATKDAESLAVVLFDDEGAARHMAEEGLRQAPPHPEVTLTEIEVREVVAHL